METQKNISDEALINLYLNGNNRAFNTLMERHQEGLLSYISYIVHDQEAAEDIFQETFIKVFLTLRDGHYTEDGKFVSWLRRIAHNLIIDTLRHIKSINTVSADAMESDIHNALSLSESETDGHITTNQMYANVHLLMSNLPAEQREVVEMRYYRNLTFKEIAERTGVSINTSLGRMRYALTNMRRIALRYELSPG